MKWSEVDRRVFKEMVNGHPFTIDDIKAFIEPTFHWDAESARNRALTALAHSFIRSFKGEDGIREAIAFNQAQDEGPAQMAFSFYGVCEDVGVVKRQIEYMEAKQLGLKKTIAKLQERKETLETQTTIFDYMPGGRSHQPEIQVSP